MSSPEDLYWVKVVGLPPEHTEDDIVAHFQTARCGSGLVRMLAYLGQLKTAAIVGIEGMDANGWCNLFYENQHLRVYAACICPTR